MLGSTLPAVFAGFLALAAASPAAPEPAAPPEPSATAQPQSSPTPAVAFDATRFELEAQAMRRRDCADALGRLKGRAEGKTDDAAAVRLLLGFYARGCKDLALAQSYLARAVMPGGVLEDWRLLLLAQTAAERGHPALARDAWASLLGDYPASPLRSEALLKASQLALETNDLGRALELAEVGRREVIAPEVAVGLEAVALQAARRRADGAAARRAAKRLLVLAPLEAARLQAADALRSATGALDWSAALTADEQRQRIDALLGLDIADGALQALAAVPAAARDARWLLQRARALTLLQRGAEAGRLLDAAPAPPATEEAAFAWARAEAIAEVLAPRDARHRKRPPLAPSARLALRDQRAALLWRVALSDVSAALPIAALHALLPELAERGSSPDLERAAQRLHDLDASDDSPTRPLWERGWQAYRVGDLRGAMGLWKVLVALYPESRSARSGVYWTARASEALGARDTARDLYREVASSAVADFYRRHAERRLGPDLSATATVDPPPAAPESREPWPSAPPLERARLLSDLGLDELALTELGAVAARVPRPPARALEALIRARQGQPREVIRLLHEAFPALGGPLQARLPEQALRLYYPLAFAERVKAVARLQGLPPELVFAIVHQESGFDAKAISHSGARGLMQLMAGTGRELARRLHLAYSLQKLTDPEFSLRLGTTYFRDVLEMFDGNLELALAGYNNGPFRIKRLWNENGRPDELDTFLEDLRPDETRAYVKRILISADTYRRLYPSIG